jgi:uncharacterized protein
MSLKDQLTEDMKSAMRARDMAKLGVIRFLMSDIKNYEIDNGMQDDAGVQSVIRKQIKQMKDAITDFEKAGRTDLVELETNKVKVLSEYLPPAMSDDELKAIIKAVATESGQTTMGPLMTAVRQKVGNQAEGGTIANFVKAYLAEQTT